MVHRDPKPSNVTQSAVSGEEARDNMGSMSNLETQKRRIHKLQNEAAKRARLDVVQACDVLIGISTITRQPTPQEALVLFEKTWDEWGMAEEEREP